LPKLIFESEKVLQSMVTQKIRLDKLLIDRGIAPTLEKARALILARAVKINESIWIKRALLFLLTLNTHKG